MVRLSGVFFGASGRHYGELFYFQEGGKVKNVKWSYGGASGRYSGDWTDRPHGGGFWIGDKQLCSGYKFSYYRI